MAKILFLHPSKWGRGITAIWIASHSAILKQNKHQVKLFDCTFYPKWTENENKFNTANLQYQQTDYERKIQWKNLDLIEDLQNCVNQYTPDIFFWSAFSSHIHGEGEYVSIQYGYKICKKIKTSALLIAGGLQATADPVLTFRKFPDIDCLIRGESELVLTEIANQCNQRKNIKFSKIKGIVYKNSDGKVILNQEQEIISNLDILSPYDYSLFDDQTLLRPYNGEVLKAVDYELSRGCVFSCSYCVETVIQKYYGFKKTLQNGVIDRASDYLRHKSADVIFGEMQFLVKKRGISFFRCQDTNFLSIHRPTLLKLADLFDKYHLPIKLYIETRPEGITTETAILLKRLRIDGIGMGIELSEQNFRESKLNRFSNQEKIIRAFKILKKNNINRTAYNVIGFPEQDEESIKKTIAFNKLLKPDNITVAFYTPYLGTQQQKIGVVEKYFKDYEFNLDAQLRSVTKHSVLSKDLLSFYKKYFVKLSREGLSHLEKYKNEAL